MNYGIGTDVVEVIRIKESIEKSFEIWVGFLICLCSSFGGFCEDFGVHGHAKMSVSPTRGAIFGKITFFMPDTVLVDF